MNIETKWMENPKWKKRKPRLGDIIIDKHQEDEMTVINYYIYGGSIIMEFESKKYNGTYSTPLDYFYEELGPYEDQAFEFKTYN